MAQVKVRNNGNGPVLLAGQYLGPGETREVNIAFYNEVSDGEKGDLEILEGNPAPIPVVDPIAGVTPAGATPVVPPPSGIAEDVPGGALAPGSVTDPGFQSYLTAEQAKAEAQAAVDQTPQPHPDPAPEYQPVIQAADATKAAAEAATPEVEAEPEEKPEPKKTKRPAKQ